MEIASGVVSNLIPKLGRLVQEEYNLQKAAKKDIQFLSTELEAMRAVLRDVSEVPPEQLSEPAKIWARDIREMSYDIEDITDTFRVRIQGPDPPSTRGTKRLIKKMVNVVTKMRTRRDIALEIMDIKKNIVEVAERRRRYDVDWFAPAKTWVDPRITAVYTKATDLVGIGKAKEEIITRLTKASTQKQVIVSIVGLGGLGKTVLASAVYDELKVQFDCTAFVSVSRNPDAKKLVKDMLYQLDKGEHGSTGSAVILEEEQLTDQVLDFLRNKRYLIVLDDIWDIKLWETIRHALHENGRIITTTRILDVAEKVGGCYKLKPLTHESSKMLFYGRIFGSEHKCPRQYYEVSEKILKKCRGVPLAIITISSFLANKIGNIEEWYDLCESIGSRLRSNPCMDNIRKIQLLSYYDIPSHLKACLLYLSIFPEDYEIRRDQLIWRWIAEDLVQHGQEGKSLFEIGESYFNELVSGSLIQPTQMNDEGMPWVCRVNDMVLDLIWSLSREENIVTTILGDTKQNTPSWEGKVRRLALHNTNEEHNLGYNMGLRKLRSLNAIGCPMYVIPPVSSFIILRVLDLESCGSMEGYDLEHLGNLLLLRFIGLRNTFVRKLPEQLRHLKFLQTLDLEGSGVEELPASMSELSGLMCLNADLTTRVPNWIGNLTSLQQLVMYPGYGDEENSARWFVRELGNLGELRVLRFLMKAQEEEELRDLLKSLSNLQKVEVIQFDHYGVPSNRNVLSFEPPPPGFSLSQNLRFLEFRGLEFSRLPEWINPGRLPKLCHLWLMVFDVDDQDLKTLGSFPGLVCLHLLIVNTERGDVTTCCSGAFQNLKFCSITKPLQFVYGAMPRLEVLDFHFNVRLLMDFNNSFDFNFGLGNLHSLQKVIVQINCLSASPEEVGKAEAAVRHTFHIHTNFPTLKLSLFGQRMELDADPTRNLEKTNEPRDELIRMLSLVDNDGYDKKMKILSIVRSEGLGKTTLAQEVFNKLSPQFDCGAFVAVGQNPDLRKVLTNILVGVDKDKYKDFPMTVLNLMELIGLLRKSLINKRFFVVVDDICDLKAWHLIKCALIENSNGSAVLTTSHDTEITKVIGGSRQLLPPLSTTDSKMLFYKKLFGSEDKCPPELENICEELIETCGGIQSVITETVELLSSVPLTLKDWQAVYDRRKLALSYPGLSDHLRNCLLYFSMFRKGFEISRERLVWAWIAEGFVQRTQGQTLQEIGESYLRKLVMENMIEAVEVDADGKALSCRAYDLVHDFIISKSIEANFAAILKDSQDRALPDTVHRLSIQGNTEVHTRPKAWLSQAKSLVVSCDTMSSVSGFPNLHVMDLGGCDSMQAIHLKGISNSTSLRYLVIGSKCIAEIPKEITKLRHLQTLDLSATGLNELPESVLSLRKLESLWVNSHMKIPDGIAKMSALQELGDVNISKPELLKKLRKLSKLRVLRIAIWSWDESSKSFVDQLCDNLRSFSVAFKGNIQSFSILTSCSLDFMDGLGDKWAPQSLQMLEIRHSAFDKLPSWFDSLSNISSLTFEVYKLSQVIIDTLGKLPTLGSLSLTSKDVPEGYFFIDSDRFKKLESLKLVSNAMKEMFAPQEEVTQRLKRVTIVFQASRTEDINKDFSFGLKNLYSLEHVRVEIICFNASHQMVSNAEAAIKEAISRDGNGSSPPNLEIRKPDENSMIKKVDLRNTEQEHMEKWRKKKSSMKKIRVTGKIFRQKRRKELVEHMRPFLDSGATLHFVPPQAP